MSRQNISYLIITRQDWIVNKSILISFIKSAVIPQI